MADFLQAEAEESDMEDSEEEAETKKKKKKAIIDSSEEEEDEEGMDKDLEGLIDDNPIEDEEDDGDEEEEGKRKHEDSDLDDELEDEDYDLIKENLGYEIKRKQKRKRIRMLSDDEESGKEGEEEDDQERIANELFEGDDDESVAPREPEPSPRHTQEYETLEASEEEESDIDDFIVDEQGQPVSRGKKKKKHIHSDADLSALQEAQDIFGVDYDFDEFDQYGEEYEDEEEDEEYSDEGEEGEGRPKAKKVGKKKMAKKTIFEVFEPSDLERAHFTDQDQEIRSADMPERFQLRGIPVRPTEEGELIEEAQWIFKYAFCTPTISKQDNLEMDQGGGGSFGSSFSTNRSPSTVDKIQEALTFMRNQQFEVPFIAFYRKEYVDPELNISDLWKVWHWDEKWTQLRSRKQNLIRLFERMQQYQEEVYGSSDRPLSTHTRPLTSDDIYRARKVQTMEELKDIYQHFLLYYGNDIPKMKNLVRSKKKKIIRRRRKKATNNEDGEKENVDVEKPEGETPMDENEDGDEGEWEEVEEEVTDDEEEAQMETLKQATRKTGYMLCQQAGLGVVAKRFGLTPEQIGENLRDNYQRHEVEQYPMEPQDLAHEFLCQRFPSEMNVLQGARHMVAMQIAHDPEVRQTVREAFRERAQISCRPTKKGLKEVDENHPCFTCKYLINKPVRSLTNDQFLKISQATDDSLLTYEIHMDGQGDHQGQTYLDEIKQLFHKDEFSHLVQEWNDQRSQALDRALTMILYPLMTKELKTKLLEESKEGIIKACSRRLYNSLKVAPYQAEQQLDEDDYDESSSGLKVMGLAFSQERDTAAFCAIVDGDGAVTDFLRLTNLLKRKNAYRQDDREGKLSDLEKLKTFISNKKPHVIAVGAESRAGLSVCEDLRGVILELEQESQMAPIPVELLDNELAVLYAQSKKSEHDFREYPVMLRQAVSLARRLQDPLIEFAQLCNSDEDILSLKYHPFQDAVSREELLNALYLEFVNRVNEVGVDVNRCVVQPHTAPLVQFVCGLGPRKGSHLLKILKQNNSRLENRTQLVTMCNMGPKVFFNCAGFIKIDTNSLGDSTDAYVEVLDGSRVHPETYEWARKMAVDALEYDDTAEDANPAGALEEILESPERLKDLDLDAFAVELERQGYGNKHITLYDIRAELNHRYKDLRTPYRSPTPDEKFNMLTKETPQTFYVGKLIMCQVIGIAHKRPQGEQLDQANPVRDDDTGLWKCPFCRKDDFPELSEVWSHFDANACPGSAVGVKTRLDNAVSGFIANRNLSDKQVFDPEERVRIGMTLHARIVKIDIDRFQVELTTKSSDLADKEGKWRMEVDLYYDHEREVDEKQKEADKKKQQARQTYIKRVIVHPAFHNIDFKKCEKLMVNMDLGEVIIRPSSKGSDHLTVTWKVAEEVCQHIDVREEGKENAFSLGQSLWINNEEFEDLDEIIARYIQPMAAHARDIINFRYYKTGRQEEVDKGLIEEKKKQPSRIPYFLSATKTLPGKFVLAYLPRKTVRREYVSVTPDGFKYRGQMFHALNSLIKWFKEHFRDPIPGTPASLRTPLTGGQSAVAATPSGAGGLDQATIQRAAAGLPSNIYNTLAQVAGQTPQVQAGNFGQGFGQGFNYQQQQQITTPLMTPMLTPSYHAGQQITTPAQQSMATPAQHMTPGHSMATPSYQATPRQNWNHPGATPSRTPARTPASRTPARTPRQEQHRQQPSKPTTSVDWAKMAELWAKRKNSDRRQAAKSPKPSPHGEGGGDSTPLIDER